MSQKQKGRKVSKKIINHVECYCYFQWRWEWGLAREFITQEVTSNLNKSSYGRVEEKKTVADTKETESTGDQK